MLDHGIRNSGLHQVARKTRRCEATAPQLIHAALGHTALPGLESAATETPVQGAIIIQQAIFADARETLIRNSDQSEILLFIR